MFFSSADEIFLVHKECARCQACAWWWWGPQAPERRRWRRASRRRSIYRAELDRLNWASNWQDLSKTNPGEFSQKARGAISADAWVSDGNYAVVRDLIWRRATYLVWLDYSRAVIMYRVIKRSITRAVDQKELWAGTEKTGVNGCGLATQLGGRG